MEDLNVIYACDDNYAPYACVSICSLLENNKEMENITVYLVQDNVSKSNLDKIRIQIEKYGAHYVQVDANEVINEIKKYGIPKYRGSYTTNFRLFFHMYIDKDVKKVFYLDCDTLILGSLKEILEEDMGEACACVVQDSLTCKYKKLIGFREDEPYFNAGVMLINVDNWKKSRCTENMIEHLQTERSAYCNPDQDLLNVILRGHLKFVGPEYNFQPIHRVLNDDSYLKIYKNSCYYDKATLMAARKNTKIIHAYRFLGQFPWHRNNRHPDTELFDKYMKLSFQKDYVKKPIELGLMFKIEHVLYKVLPLSVFFKIFKFTQEFMFNRDNEKLKKSGKK